MPQEALKFGWTTPPAFREHAPLRQLKIVPPVMEDGRCHFAGVAGGFFWLPRSVQLVPASDGGRDGGLGDFGSCGLLWHPLADPVSRCIVWRCVSTTEPRSGDGTSVFWPLLSYFSLGTVFGSVPNSVKCNIWRPRLIWTSVWCSAARPWWPRGSRPANVERPSGGTKNCVPLGAGSCVGRILSGWLSSLVPYGPWRVV